MGYSISVPLGFGVLKLKTISRLRSDEEQRKMPVWQLGKTYFVWRSHGYEASRNAQKSAIDQGGVLAPSNDLVTSQDMKQLS